MRYIPCACGELLELNYTNAERVFDRVYDEGGKLTGMNITAFNFVCRHCGTIFNEVIPQERKKAVTIENNQVVVADQPVEIKGQ